MQKSGGTAGARPSGMLTSVQRDQKSAATAAGALPRLPKLCRKAWVMLRTTKPRCTQPVYTLAYAELMGLQLTLYQVSNDAITDGTSEPCRTTLASINVNSFTYFVEQERYFLNVVDADGRSTCFMTKNQADISLKSSEQEFLNWQRMLAASLNMHLLEQKQYLIDPACLPKANWEPLGSGSFGQVYKARLNGITPVAVKTVSIYMDMDPTKIDEKHHVDFINEALISSSIQGPCLLHFYGLFWDPADNDEDVFNYYMVNELCEGGDLRQLLYDIDDSGVMTNSRERLPTDVIIKLLRELWSGLGYMHQSSIVHRDIKPDNIVLLRPIDQLGRTNGSIVKIIDYGHSRTLPSQFARLNPGVLTANDRGTELYRAPETVAVKGRSAEYSTKVDIYATGVICWEMWTRELPFSDVQSKSRVRVEQLVAEGHRPTVPIDCPPGFASLIRRCWAHNPSERASADDALQLTMHPHLFNDMKTNGAPAAFDAVATGFWEWDPPLRSQLMREFDNIRATEPSPKINYSDHIPAVVTIFQQLVFKRNPLASIPLDAIVLTISMSSDEVSVCDMLTSLNLVSIVIEMLAEFEESCEKDKLNCLTVILMYTKILPELESWGAMRPTVMQILEKKRSTKLKQYCIRFLASMAKNEKFSRMFCETEIIDAVIEASLSEAADLVLLSASAAYLAHAIKSAGGHLKVQSAVPQLISLFTDQIRHHDVASNWIDVFATLSNNTLSCIQAVQAGMIEAIVEGVREHSNDLKFAVAFLRVIDLVTSEPTYAIKAAHEGALAEVVKLMKTFSHEGEVELLSMSIFANSADVPSLQRRVANEGAAEAFFKAMRAPLRNGVLQTHAFRMATSIAADDRLLVEVFPPHSCNIILQVVEAILHLSLAKPIPYGLQLLCRLLLAPSHSEVMLELGGPRVLTYALSTVGSTNNFEIPPESLSCLVKLCWSPETSMEVVLAKGVSIIVGATRYENDPVHLELLVKCITGMAKHTDAPADLLRQGTVDVLARIMLKSAAHETLLETSMVAIRQIAERCDCSSVFESLQLKRTITSIMSCFPENEIICSNGKDAIEIAVPYLNDADITSDLVSVGETNALLVEPRVEAQFKVILIGDASVGKSCIAVRACQQLFSPKIKATIGVSIDFAELKFPMQKVTLQIYDTAGQEQFRALTRQFYRGCHAALLVYDITRPSTFESLPGWYAELKAASDSVRFVAIVGAKSDLAAGSKVPESKANSYARKIRGQHFLVSAVANTGVQPLFRRVAERLTELYPDGHDGAPSGTESGAFSLRMTGSESTCCF